MSPFTREIYIDAIKNALSYLRTQVELNNAINKYSINIEAEVFYAGFLNVVFGFNLKDGNHVKNNIPSIDLYEEYSREDGQRVAVQVTSDNKAAKIKNTLESFSKYEYQKDFTRLIILMITKKKKYRTDFSALEEIGIEFDQNRDILDIYDWLKHINSIEDTNHLRSIYEYLKKELSSRILGLDETPGTDYLPNQPYKESRELAKCSSDFPTASGRNPVYITERPAIGVDYLFGRERDIEKIEEAVLHRGKVMISGVGGIGKTELVKRFLLNWKKDLPSEKLPVFLMITMICVGL